MKLSSPALRRLPSWLVMMAVAVVSLVVANPAWSQDSFEPNDTPAQAHQITQSGVPIESWISSESDSDWYVFEQAEQGAVRIQLTSLAPEVDYDVCVYASATDSLCSDNPDNDDEDIQATATAGVYYIQVYPWSGFSSDSYILTVDFIAGSGGNEPPSVTVTSPAGGESYTGGSTQSLSYVISDNDGDSQSTTWEYSTNGGSSWTVISSGTRSVGSHTESWTVANVETSSGRIRVTANDGQASGSGQSNAFSITVPQSGNNTLALGAASGEVGQTVTINLDLDNEDTVKGLQVDVTFDASKVAFTNATTAGRTSQFDISSNTVSTGRARVVLFTESTPSSVLSAGTGAVAQLSFSLVSSGTSTLNMSGAVLSSETGTSLSVDASDTGSVTATGGGQDLAVSLVAPTGGEVLSGGSIQNVQWVATGGSGSITVELEYSTNGGSSWNNIQNGLSSSGTYSWSVPSVSTNSARVLVIASDGSTTAQDESSNFTINTSSGGNVVSVGSVSGGNGETVPLSLSVNNDDTVKALQLDLDFDPAVVSFSSAVPTGRGAAMEADASTVSSGRARVVLYFDDTQTLGAGNGTVANLNFRLVGGLNAQSTITPVNLVLSDPNANSLAATGQAGVATVTSGPKGAPEVQVSVLKNPGSNRVLDIHVLVEGGSGSTPSVTVGGAAVTMAGAGGLFKGQFYVTSDVSSVTVSASDTNGVGTGTDSKTVSF